MCERHDLKQAANEMMDPFFFHIDSHVMSRIVICQHGTLHAGRCVAMVISASVLTGNLIIIARTYR